MARCSHVPYISRTLRFWGPFLSGSYSASILYSQVSYCKGPTLWEHNGFKTLCPQRTTKARFPSLIVPGPYVQRFRIRAALGSQGLVFLEPYISRSVGSYNSPYIPQTLYSHGSFISCRTLCLEVPIKKRPMFLKLGIHRNRIFSGRLIPLDAIFLFTRFTPTTLSSQYLIFQKPYVLFSGHVFSGSFIPRNVLLPFS